MKPNTMYNRSTVRALKPPQPQLSGSTNLGPHGVLDAYDADAGQPGEDVVLAVPVGLAVGD